MTVVLFPAGRLMEQLRLLPKFLLVALMFILPCLLVTALLFNELEKSITFAVQERDGLHYLSQTEDVRIVLRQHRALRHMELGAADHLAKTCA